MIKNDQGGWECNTQPIAFGIFLKTLKKSTGHAFRKLFGPLDCKIKNRTITCFKLNNSNVLNNPPSIRNAPVNHFSEDHCPKIPIPILLKPRKRTIEMMKRQQMEEKKG
jgi:hypothetical protein